MKVISKTAPDTKLDQDLRNLAQASSQWFVRRDNKFFDINRLNTPLARNDIEMMILHRIKQNFPAVILSNELIKNLFKLIVDTRHTDTTQTIPVWNGTIICDAGNSRRVVWQDGAVSVNCWREPAYRSLRVNAAEFGLCEDFFAFFFQRADERDMFLNWLAWCLQNEGLKPAWAPFFFSRSKGTGKSTLCKLVSKLFGEQNSVTQNNLDKLSGRFNATVLQSKLIISEETQLRPGSTQGNAIKTYITESHTLVEQKGREAERVRQSCCFLFTSNHLPSWIEPDDRRYYVMLVDHDGHASGPRARDFSELVGRLHAYIEDEVNLAKVYNVLLRRQLPDSFNPMSLNIVEDATPVMRQIQQTGRHTMVDQLEEQLNERGFVALPESEVAAFIRKTLGGNMNQTKYLMSDIGWEKQKVKWGGVDYSRAIWVKPEYFVVNGRLQGPDLPAEPLADYLQRHNVFADVDLI